MPYSQSFTFTTLPHQHNHLEAVLVGTDGVVVGDPIQTGFIEIDVEDADGTYLWTGTAIPTAFQGCVVFRQRTGAKPTLAMFPINPDVQAILAALAALRAARAVVLSPISAEGNLTLVAGAAYQAERSTAIAWLYTGPVDLSGAAQVELRLARDGVTLPDTPWPVTVTGAVPAQVVTVDDVTVAQTLVLGLGRAHFGVWGVWADEDADAVPVIRGYAVVQPSP